MLKQVEFNTPMATENFQSKELRNLNQLLENPRQLSTLKRKMRPTFWRLQKMRRKKCGTPTSNPRKFTI